MTRHSKILAPALLGGVVLTVAGACAPAVSPAGRACGADSVNDPACVDVGYGFQPRRTLSGAITSYIPTADEASGKSRVEELIEGRLAGVRVERISGGDYTIHVRGGGTSANDGEPLIVVDGMAPPLGLASRTILSSINPSTVARIDVLRDGSSAIYGSRGANGVILITTKR